MEGVRRTTFCEKKIRKHIQKFEYNVHLYFKDTCVPPIVVVTLTVTELEVSICLNIRTYILREHFYQ
jgi:hypothetical protein